MKYHTTIYRLTKDGDVRTFASEKDACNFLGIGKCNVSSAYRRGYKCKGWNIEKVGSSSHGDSQVRLFKIWEGMHERCRREKHPHYKDYGGRGIAVCNEWNEYVSFKKWAFENGYTDNLTIDRIDPNGNYCPENCKWATMQEQQNNKRNNHYISLNSETHTISEWSEMLGINKTTLKERLAHGWSDEATIMTPVRKRTRGYRVSRDFVIQKDGERI